MELIQALIQHAGRYPYMDPVDAVKIVYQAVCGPGHLIDDPVGNYEGLEEEYSRHMGENYSGGGCPAYPLYEDVGGGVGRCHLQALPRRLLPQLQSEFMRTAQSRQRDLEALEQALQLLEGLAKLDYMPFHWKALRVHLDVYRLSGYPPMSHGVSYTEQYHPAYRVVEGRSSLFALMQTIRDRLGPYPLVLAIDGRCAAGKSTLADFLASYFDGAVIHLDDFFLRPEQRTQQRYDTPGENVDHERFYTEVLTPLRTGQAFSYRPFDCHTMALKEPVLYTPHALTILEGSYACHRQLWEGAHIHVFLDVDPDEQTRRIQSRNPDMAETFQKRWIPLEERYLADRHLQDICDYHLQLAQGVLLPEQADPTSDL